MTILRVYVALGLAGTFLFGSVMLWTENRMDWTENRRLEPLRLTMNYLALACFPAVLIAGLIIALGSIGL